MPKPSEQVLAFLESLEKENPEEFKHDEKAIKRKYIREHEAEEKTWEELIQGQDDACWAEDEFRKAYSHSYSRNQVKGDGGNVS